MGSASAIKICVVHVSLTCCSACARNKDYLVRIGVSHVLNAAEGTSVGMANTNAAYYDGLSITYMGLPVVDDPAYEISAHFQTAAEFVRSGIVSGGM